MVEYPLSLVLFYFEQIHSFKITNKSKTPDYIFLFKNQELPVMIPNQKMLNESIIVEILDQAKIPKVIFMDGLSTLQQFAREKKIIIN